MVDPRRLIQADACHTESESPSDPMVLSNCPNRGVNMAESSDINSPCTGKS
jgi:hypothetical protein